MEASSNLEAQHWSSGQSQATETEGKKGGNILRSQLTDSHTYSHTYSNTYPHTDQSTHLLIYSHTQPNTDLQTIKFQIIKAGVYSFWHIEVSKSTHRHVVLIS